METEKWSITDYRYMETGVFVLPSEPGRLSDSLLTAQNHGFDFAGVADSQLLLREVYTSLGAVASEVDSIEIGPLVTNPVTRHSSVTASALCTLDELTGGNAVLGVGSGDTAVRLAGRDPATLADLEDFVAEFHALCRGEKVTYGDIDAKLSWNGGDTSIPVLLTAEGPETLELAGRIADRVVIANGITEEIVAESVRRVETGARAAGRDPDAVKKILWVRCASSRSGDIDRDFLKLNAAGTSSHVFQAAVERNLVPEQYRDAVRSLVRQYDKQHHLGLGGDENANLQLLDRLDSDTPGLADYLLERFYMTGTPSQCATQIKNLTNETAIDGMYFNIVSERDGHNIGEFSEDVLGRISI